MPAATFVDDSDEIVIRARLRGEFNIECKHENDPVLNPDTAVHVGVDATVLSCYMSPFQVSGMSNISCPFDGIALVDVKVNDSLERVDMYALLADIPHEANVAGVNVMPVE